MQLVPTTKVPRGRNHGVGWYALNMLYVRNGLSPVLASSVTKLIKHVDTRINATAVVSELHKLGYAKKVA